MERLKQIKNCLMSTIENQMSHLEEVDAHELGEVMDMVKDCEEAMYYHSIVEAMEAKQEEHLVYAREPLYEEARHGTEEREGYSSRARRSYMESKELHKDKTIQMQELEKYTQELAKDVTEMIADATPEEKSILQQKLVALANKIK